MPLWLWFCRLFYQSSKIPVAEQVLKVVDVDFCCVDGSGQFKVKASVIFVKNVDGFAVWYGSGSKGNPVPQCRGSAEKPGSSSSHSTLTLGGSCLKQKAYFFAQTDESVALCRCY